LKKPKISEGTNEGGYIQEYRERMDREMRGECMGE
jgi:hypothetical protein